jgi:hypothetical protein
MTLSISDGHRIAGEYLADPQWAVIRYSVSEHSIDLGVAADDVTSIRHAYDVAAGRRHCDVLNTPLEDGQRQLVTVSFRHPAGVFVYVSSVHTDPAVIERLRVVEGRDQRVISALSDAALEPGAGRADGDQGGV